MADRLRHPGPIRTRVIETSRVFELMREHTSKVGAQESDDELISALLDIFEPEAFPAEIGDETYSI
jgi:hypothetical protein